MTGKSPYLTRHGVRNAEDDGKFTSLSGGLGGGLAAALGRHRRERQAPFSGLAAHFNAQSGRSTGALRAAARAESPKRPRAIRGSKAGPAASVDDRPPPAHVDAQVRNAYRGLARRPGDWISIADLRERLDSSGITTRSEQDAALKRLITQPGVSIIPEADQSTLRERDRLAAPRIGGEEKHLIAMEENGVGYWGAAAARATAGADSSPPAKKAARQAPPLAKATAPKSAPKLYATDTGGLISREEAGRRMFGDAGKPEPRRTRPLAKAGARLGGLSTEQHASTLEAMTSREDADRYLAGVKGAELTALARHYHANASTVAERRERIAFAAVGLRLDDQAIARLGNPAPGSTVGSVDAPDLRAARTKAQLKAIADAEGIPVSTSQPMESMRRAIANARWRNANPDMSARAFSGWDPTVPKADAGATPADALPDGQRQIAEIVGEIQGRTGNPVGLDVLRPRLAALGMSRAEQDRHLTALAFDSRAGVLVPEANQKILTEEEIAAAIPKGRGLAHSISIKPEYRRGPKADAGQAPARRSSVGEQRVVDIAAGILAGEGNPRDVDRLTVPDLRRLLDRLGLPASHRRGSGRAALIRDITDPPDWLIQQRLNDRAALTRPK